MDDSFFHFFIPCKSYFPFFYPFSGMLLYVGMFSGYSVSSFFGSFLTTFLTALHFSFLNNSASAFGFSETSLWDLFCPNRKLPLVLRLKLFLLRSVFVIHFCFCFVSFRILSRDISLYCFLWTSPCALSLRMVSQALSLSWFFMLTVSCCLELNLSGFTCTLVSPLVSIRYHSIFRFSIWNIG